MLVAHPTPLSEKCAQPPGHVHNTYVSAGATTARNPMIRNMVLLANQDIRAGDLKGSGRHSSKVYIGSSAPGREALIDYDCIRDLVSLLPT